MSGSIRVLLLLGPRIYASDIAILALLLVSPLLLLLFLNYRRPVVKTRAASGEPSGSL